MEEKYCPLLSALAHKDVLCCEERCAWYTETVDERGCAVAVLAENMAAAAKSADYIVENLEEIGGRI